MYSCSVCAVSSVTATTATVFGKDLAGNDLSTTDSITFTIDNILPTVSLSDTDSDNLVSNSSVVTITATFSESMSATTTLNLSGVTSNILMIGSASNTVWTYAWAVSGTTVSSTTATVSATDLVGNPYSGSDNLVFTIDNQAPLILSTSIVGNNEKILISYSEPVQLSSSLNNVEMHNFIVTQNASGTATVSYTGYTLGTTQSNTVILNFDVVNLRAGEEL